ncbi:hypothetical protein [Trueperella pyogenes]|uniref:hypothetical protein n=1 Tax=Trueperella pyogenes TaxID=1661 RepID=UPI00312BA48B
MTLLFSAAVIGTVGGGAYYFARGRKAAESREWVGESVKAWRSNELDGGRFEVRMQETHLDELFTTFDHDESNPYYTPEEIEEKVSKAVGSSIPHKILDFTELVVLRVVSLAKAAKVKIFG